MQTSKPTQAKQAHDRSTEVHKRNQAQLLGNHATTYFADPLNTGTIQRSLVAPSSLTSIDVLQLQRTIGNQAVARLLVRQQPLSPQNKPPVIQRKAPVNEPVAWRTQPIVQRKKDKDPRQRQEDNFSQIQNFAERYMQVVGPLANLKIELTARLQQYATTVGAYGLEDYSEQVFTDTNARLLSNINDGLEEGENDKRQQTGEYVADLLLFASLIPVHERKRKRGLLKARYDRMSIEAISPNKLSDTLAQIASQMAAGGDIEETQALKGTGLDKGDTVAQRMLKMSLINMKETARQQMNDNPLFQIILTGSNIMEVMMASSGSIDQRFLNTCAAAAVTQQIQSQVSSIIGLLEVGRAMTKSIERQVDKEPNEHNKLGEKVKKRGFGKKHTVKSLALKRVNDARTAFDKIQSDAQKILTKSPVQVEKLQKLTQRWSRVMQKLAGVAEVDKGEAHVPVLSKNRVKGHWNAGAVATFLLGAPFDRAKKRKQGTDDHYFIQDVKESLDLQHGFKKANPKLNVWLNKNGDEGRVPRMTELWDNVFAAGGVLLAVPGHALYLKAMKRGKTKMFAIGDPVVDKYDYYTIEEMEQYVLKQPELQIQEFVLSNTTFGGYLTQDNVPAYSTPSDFAEKNDPRMLSRKARVIKAKQTVHEEQVVIAAELYPNPDDILLVTRYISPEHIVVLS